MFVCSCLWWLKCDTLSLIKMVLWVTSQCARKAVLPEKYDWMVSRRLSPKIQSKIPPKLLTQCLCCNSKCYNLTLLPRVNDVAGSLIHPWELILVLLVYFKSVRITICNMTSQRDSANPTGAFSPHKIAGWGSCPLVFTEPLKVTESHSATANTTTQMFSKTKRVNYYAKPCNW